MTLYLLYHLDYFKSQELKAINMWYSFKHCFAYVMVILVGIGGSLVSVLALEKGQYLLAISPFIFLFPVTAVLLSMLLEE